MPNLPAGWFHKGRNFSGTCLSTAPIKPWYIFEGKPTLAGAAGGGGGGAEGGTAVEAICC